MTALDPYEHRAALEAYLSCLLEQPVQLVRAAQLTKGTREAPWRLDVRVGGAARSYVLQLDAAGMAREYRALQAMARVPVPTPRAYGLDLAGVALGVPCLVREYIEGDSLLGPMLAGEAWAEAVYIDTVLQLQAVTPAQLGDLGATLPREPASRFLEDAYAALRDEAMPLVERAHEALKERMPDLPAARFSNGDLWLDNFIVRQRALAGVIDFANASFSDPVYEFLLAFFVEPRLQGRGIEPRYCRAAGHDPGLLGWYRGLEFLDTLRWVVVTGRPFVHHTRESLEHDLAAWLAAL